MKTKYKLNREMEKFLNPPRYQRFSQSNKELRNQINLPKREYIGPSILSTLSFLTISSFILALGLLAPSYREERKEKERISNEYLGVVYEEKKTAWLKERLFDIADKNHNSVIDENEKESVRNDRNWFKEYITRQGLYPENSLKLNEYVDNIGGIK